MSDPGEELISKTRTPFSGPPQVKARSLENQPDHPEKAVLIFDPVLVSELASALGLKPFQIVADLLELKLFKSPKDELDFETASLIARKHGYRVKRAPPGVLVL